MKVKVLIDLERTIGTGVVHYWNTNKHGYTLDIGQAGFFSEEVAEQIVNDDFDKRTVAVDLKVIEGILKG